MNPKLITTSPEAAPDYQNIGEVMSNFDYAIDREIADLLKLGECCAEYPGWNFFGMVWFDRDEKVFKCQVKRHRVHVATAMSDELREIMTVISDEYGWD